MTRTTLALFLFGALSAGTAHANCPALYASEDCSVGTFVSLPVCERDGDTFKCGIVTEGTGTGRVVMVNDFDGQGEHVYSAWGWQPNGDLFCCAESSTAANPLCDVKAYGHYDNDTNDDLFFRYNQDDLGTNQECSGDFTATALGHGGNDQLLGSRSTVDYVETLRGGSGDDDIEGSDGDDTLEGGPGDDVLCGEGGSDDLSGGTGDDALFGGSDVDSIDGGPHVNGDECASPGHLNSNATDCESTAASGCPI